MTWLRGITCTPPRGTRGSERSLAPQCSPAWGRRPKRPPLFPQTGDGDRQTEGERERESKARGLQDPGTMTTAQPCLSTADARGLLWPPPTRQGRWPAWASCRPDSLQFSSGKRLQVGQTEGSPRGVVGDRRASALPRRDAPPGPHNQTSPSLCRAGGQVKRPMQNPEKGHTEPGAARGTQQPPRGEPCSARPWGVGRAVPGALGRVPGATSGGDGGTASPPWQPYLLLLHAPQGLTDEPDVLAGERAQLTVASPQVHVLGAEGRPQSALPLPRAHQALRGFGSAHPPAPPPLRLTSWMTLSDPDWTLGFLAGEATGSSCALYVTS